MGSLLTHSAGTSGAIALLKKCSLCARRQVDPSRGDMAEVGGLFKKKAGKKKKTISISDETIKNAYEKEHIDADKLSTGLSSIAIDTDGWTDQGEAAKKKAVITLGKKLADLCVCFARARSRSRALPRSRPPPPFQRRRDQDDE